MTEQLVFFVRFKYLQLQISTAKTNKISYDLTHFLTGKSSFSFSRLYRGVCVAITTFFDCRIGWNIETQRTETCHCVWNCTEIFIKANANAWLAHLKNNTNTCKLAQKCSISILTSTFHVFCILFFRDMQIQDSNTNSKVGTHSELYKAKEFPEHIDKYWKFSIR